MASKLISTEVIAVPQDPWVTAEEMENACCVPTAPPPCEKIVEPWNGYTREEILDYLGIELDSEGRNADGDLVEILLVRPKSGKCGEKETTFLIEPQDCCEGVSQLSWDTGLSVEVLPPDSGGAVGIVGGRGPYTWSVGGYDVTFDHGLREIETGSQYVWLHTGPDFCGTATLQVTDVCGNTATGYVKSTDGQWVLVSSDPCYYPGCGEFVLGQTAVCINDNYKVTQLAWTSNGLNCFFCTPEEAAERGASLCVQVGPGEPPCFTVPAEWVPCGNNNYWWWVGAAVVLITFSEYKAYEWRC